ncbi:uncharacterized protein LY79DRAFT_67334 [Colletotrichum navitas]|uniref:Uncharacterized protein n=1 Tax=Colletotrichum navitas TaxID=681940 RepID=A0AAD8UZG8_9PEZI|nr:uncharacterized protein LY79DRAFT_67334 [Colletotrichum navitas]KAK1569779.1 hypothetical protein LY79DRAFT_67334 [Colletotrichum navitas]
MGSQAWHGMGACHTCRCILSGHLDNHHRPTTHLPTHTHAQRCLPYGTMPPKLYRKPPMRSFGQLKAKSNRDARRRRPSAPSEWWKISWKIRPPSWYSLRLDLLGVQRNSSGWSGQGQTGAKASRTEKHAESQAPPHALLTHQLLRQPFYIGWW